MTAKTSQPQTPTGNPLVGYLLLFIGPSVIAYIWSNLIDLQSTFLSDQVIPKLKSLLGLA